jgi:hypothetical protein
MGLSLPTRAETMQFGCHGITTWSRAIMSHRSKECVKLQTLILAITLKFGLSPADASLGRPAGRNLRFRPVGDKSL